MRLLLSLFLALNIIAISSCTSSEAEQHKAPPDGINREILPIQPPKIDPITEMDARNVKTPERLKLKAPEGAPNVVIVLIDDIGFGATSTFGGPISTPTFDRLANEGLRFNRFHTTALCSPTRASLLSGRNHHAVNVGSVMEIATGFPGNQGQRPDNAKYVAETLRQNGYSTAAFGKWHETAAWEVSVSGPFFRWPTNSGFDKFYGFIGGETNQWEPLIYDGVTIVEKKDLEIESLNDKYLRLYSEFDNFRRRTQKEKLELYKTAGEDIFKSLLPVMDDFERAKKSMEENKNYDSLKEGVDLIYNKILGVFKANGLETMESSIGKTFDSEIHEAITQIPAPSKKLKGKVVDEIERGYILKEKVIRYAKVVVGQ